MFVSKIARICSVALARTGGALKTGLQIRRSDSGQAPSAIGKATIVNQGRSNVNKISVFLNGLQTKKLQIAEFSTSADANSTRFIIDRAISAASYRDCYLLDPSEENKKDLIPAILRGDYITFYGARGSGKTTRLLNAMVQIAGHEKFKYMHIDMKALPPFEFWKAVGFCLADSIHCRRMESKEDIFNYFERHFVVWKVVLFIDNIDHLPKEVKDEFLHLLYSLRTHAPSFSVVMAGTFSVPVLGAEAINISEKIEVRNWSRDEVKQLLSQYSTEISDEISHDIHERTNGHAALVGVCCHAIATNPSIAKDIRKWLQYATTSLMKNLPSWMHSMTHKLSLTEADLKLGHATQHEIDLAMQCRQFLRTAIYSGLQPFSVTATDQVQLARHLAANGVLMALSHNTFKIPSPLIYNLISNVTAVDRRNLIYQIMPDLCDETEIRRLVKQVVKQFDLLAYPIASTKSLHTDHLSGSREEAVFVAEFFAVLRALLPKDIYTLVPEINDSANPRSGLLIGLHSNQPGVYLEICTSASKEALAKRKHAAHRYALLLGAEQAWMLHVTNSTLDLRWWFSDWSSVATKFNTVTSTRIY